MMIPMTDLFHDEAGQGIDLPERLARFYGRLWFPEHFGRVYVISNFVSTMDGVVSLSVPGHESGGDISGFYLPDQAVMGLLRACADAVIVGATQLRRPPGTIWLPGTVYPDFAGEYRQLRHRMGKTGEPVQVIVSSSGELDLSLPIFNQSQARVVILTTPAGQRALAQHGAPGSVQVQVVADTDKIAAGKILSSVEEIIPGGLALIEGGPNLVGDFIDERLLDELFLTLAPQIAGRGATLLRPGFAMGTNFAPADEHWCRLAGLKQSGDYLFMRYRSINGYAKFKE